MSSTQELDHEYRALTNLQEHLYHLGITKKQPASKNNDFHRLAGQFVQSVATLAVRQRGENAAFGIIAKDPSMVLAVTTSKTSPNELRANSGDETLKDLLSEPVAYANAKTKTETNTSTEMPLRPDQTSWKDIVAYMAK